MHCVFHKRTVPSIFWTLQSQSMSETIWSGFEAHRVQAYQPSQYGFVFLAGTDWRAYLPMRPSDRSQPVINLIQHVRHADPASDVYPFLTEKAIRICVSAEVEQMILASGRVNGPTFTIPNGVDIKALASYAQPKVANSVYVLGNKQPVLAREIELQLRQHGMDVQCHAEHVDRSQVLQAMARADVSVLLPHETEGFYLPALEAMALDSLTIVPDCVGNRGFCRTGDTCTMPVMTIDAMLDAVDHTLKMLGSGAALDMRKRARAQVAEHDLRRERAAFHDILDNLDTIW